MGAITDMAITPNGTTLYVSVATFLNAVIPISTRTGRAGKPIHLSRDGMLVMGGQNIIRITPDGQTAYVLLDQSGLALINTATNQVRKRIDIGKQPAGIAITPDGKTVYVAAMGRARHSLTRPLACGRSSRCLAEDRPHATGSTPAG